LNTLGIKKRLSTDVKLVCRFDPAVVDIESKKVRDYLQTLDIAKLGDMTDLADKPSVFTVRPLSVNFEYMANDSDSDYWGIFAHHVKAVTELDFNLSFSEGSIDYKHREDFPPRIVKDVAEMIIMLANDGRDSTFFTPPENYLAWATNVKAHRVSAQIKASALSVDAKVSKPEPDPSP
jgi:hypothetical protein